MANHLPHIRETRGMLELSLAIERIEVFKKAAARYYTDMTTSLISSSIIDRHSYLCAESFGHCANMIEATIHDRPACEMWLDAFDRAFEVFLELEKQL